MRGAHCPFRRLSNSIFQYPPILCSPNLPRSRHLTTASEPPVLFSIDGSKACITLNRPKSGNSLDRETKAQFIAHLQGAVEDESVRAVLLNAKGKFFCTGMDMSSTGGASAGAELNELFELTAGMFESVSQCRKPVVAIIQGNCYGVGTCLAMSCDVRIVVGPDVTFSAPEARFGFTPAITAKYLVREMGVSKAREAMLTGRNIPASELLSSSIVHWIEPDKEKAHSKANEIVDMMSLGGPEALANIKSLANVSATESAESMHQSMKRVFMDMMRPSEEASYGLRCFRDKVQPDWGNRRSCQ